ncbi:transmembrane protein 180-like isoform X3 [Neofelis nebulosa]|uniref:transmembrane protein 180-like isoform X3 n=1 Tax=Neofelis nebulosa TaxID=61452 RepID=UPI0027299A84|nr:transmembrane protein 180-like isoform X3 [Neofelis nebulosa]
MTLLSIKPIAWAYAMITLGIEMLNSVFSFYYVKLFLHLYKISEVAFYQAQMILMIWNALNDLTGYFHNSQAGCCSDRHSSVLYGAPLYSIAFLLPWFPWKYYHEGDWLSGLHLVVSLCAFDSTLTFVQQAQCMLFAEIFTRHESRLQLIKINQVASLVGSTSILFGGLISDNMEIFFNFQAFAVLIAILATASLYTGMYHMSHFGPKRSPEENLFSESEQDLPWTSIVSLMRQLLTQKNVCLFLIMSFFQVFHLTFFKNFMMIFADNLIPEDVLPSFLRSIMYGAGFICPQCLVLISQSWLKKFGYYKIILISFYLEGTASIVMSLLGQQYYYLLALYLTIIMSPLSSMVFGINALFTKPAQSLAPMMILSKLKQYGYGNADKSTIFDLHDAMFNLICLFPLGIAVIQILVWSPFSMRNKTDYTGAL